MRELWRKEVLDSVVNGIKRSQKDFKNASESPLYWAPEYLITVYIFQSLSKTLDSNSIDLELSPVEVTEVKTRASKLSKNKRVGKQCRCDIVLWGGKDKRRVVIEVKKYASDCLCDIDRILHLLKKTPGMYYAVLATCMQEEVKNGNKRAARMKIVNYLDKLLSKVRDQAGKEGFLRTELIPENVPTQIKPLKTECDIGEIKHWVWRPVCFVVFNKRPKQ